MLEFYGLREQPFVGDSGRTFGPLDRMRREVLATLYFGVLCNRNLLTLVAADGLGKTLLLGQLAERLQRDARVAVLVGAAHERSEFLRDVLEAFRLAPSGLDLVAMRNQLYRIAVDGRQTGRRSVLIVDDAHNLDASSLEEIEQLSCLGAALPDLLQVVLAGTPSLAGALQNERLAAFRQRLTWVRGLAPLSPADTAAYIDHRLRVAGYDETRPLFTPDALQHVAAVTNGVPHRIDGVCRRAITLGYARGVVRLGRLIVEEATGRPDPDRSRPAQAAGQVMVEQLFESLPVAVGHGRTPSVPTTGGPVSTSRHVRSALRAVGGQALAPATSRRSPVAELSPATAAPVVPGPVAHVEARPAVEEAVEPRERVAWMRPSANAFSWLPTRTDAAPFDPASADTAADVPEERPITDATRRREKRRVKTGTPVSYAPPVNSPPLSKLVQNLLAVRDDPGPRNILFASVDQGAQTARLCADVAKTLAARGASRVLVVNADRNLPALQEQFGVGRTPGLAEVLGGGLSIDEAVVPVGPNLSVLTSGLVTAQGASCLLPEQVDNLTSELKRRFDYVLVNGMPLEQGSDCVAFGRSAEGVLLVVAAHATRRMAARQAKAQLETAGARLLGAVLTERTFPIPDAVYRWL